MNDKYTYNLENDAFDIREFDADTRALRLKLFDDSHVDPTTLTLSEQNQKIADVSDNWLFENLRSISGYGETLYNQIKDSEDFKKLKQLNYTDLIFLKTKLLLLFL